MYLVFGMQDSFLKKNDRSFSYMGQSDYHSASPRTMSAGKLVLILKSQIMTEIQLTFCPSRVINVRDKGKEVHHDDD